MNINRDVLAGRWKQITGRLKQRRAVLVHNNRDRIAGWFQLQAALLQERRGRIAARAKRGWHNVIGQRKS